MLKLMAQRRTRPSLTPLIDVVFLLLIFFMIVSRLSIEQQVPLKLASAGTATTSASDTPDIRKIELQMDGRFSLGGELLGETALITRLKHQRDIPVELFLAEDISFQQALLALEILQKSGLTKVSLALTEAHP